MSNTLNHGQNLNLKICMQSVVDFLIRLITNDEQSLFSPDSNVISKLSRRFPLASQMVTFLTEKPA